MMSTARVHNVIEQVKLLSPEEREHLRQFLEGAETPPLPPVADEDEQRKLKEFERLLLERGIVNRIPPPITDFTPYQNRRRIRIKGKPLSQTIIEERR